VGYGRQVTKVLRAAEAKLARFRRGLRDQCERLSAIETPPSRHVSSPTTLTLWDASIKEGLESHPTATTLIARAVELLDPSPPSSNSAI
jgi:hypothetical protein